MCNCNKSSTSSKKNPVKGFIKSLNSSGISLNNNKSFKTNSSAPSSPVEIDGGTMEEKCQTFAYMLGLDNPVPERVLAAALDYPGYARRLLYVRDNPEQLYDMLNNPPVVSQEVNFSNAALITKAGKALAKWAISGFPTVSKETLKRREDACLGCANLIEPINALQRMASIAATSDAVGRRTGNKVCSSCGCVVANKIRLATESCPEKAPGESGLSMWGE